MNNDKRIILAIALYAAVITMVLHTLDSEAHERFTVTKEFVQINTCEETTSVTSMAGGVCTDFECNEQEMFSSQPDSYFSKENDAIVVDELVNG
jgi:hypothetical protein